MWLSEIGRGDVPIPGARAMELGCFVALLELRLAERSHDVGRLP
jgi:hypothetical protein